MALRDQPYLPLYVQDFMTDEKLIECSASATGVYTRCMCIMHKSEKYGTILLKQKDKQKSSKIENFAIKLAKQMPYTYDIILSGLNELLEEDVLKIEGDYLLQKRMIEDNELSLIRTESAKKKVSKNISYDAKPLANTPANAENENESENKVKKEIEAGFPFYTKTFTAVWSKWLKYRGQIGKRYKSIISEDAALKKLSKYSEKEAIEMINQSIENSWQGLFEIKSNGKQNYKNRHEPISNEELLESLKRGNPGVIQ